MELFDNPDFFFRTADEQLDFRVFLHGIDSTADSGELLRGVGAFPEINAAAVHRGGAFQVAVVQGENKMGEAGMTTALRPVYHHFRGPD